ncbi:MAG: tetratricopeptide repeat protein [Roseivirga sp.]|nr:tetratricopeptide repeat protein [Roseivirga sp.]
MKIKTDILIGQRLRRSNLDSSEFYLDRALTLAKRNSVSSPHLEGQALRALAEAYRLNGDERGLDFYREALVVFETLDSKQELAFTQSELGKFFEARSEFDSSTYHYERVIERNLADGTDYWMARSYNNAGLDYYYMRKLEKASRLLLDGIRYIKSTPDTMSLRAFYMNYGLVLKQQDQYELSKEYMKQALAINIHIGNKLSAATAYTNIGQTLIKQDSLDKAFESLTKGWELAREVNRSTWPTADYYKNLARIEFLKGNFQQSHDYIVKSVANLPDGVAPQSRGDIYGSLVEQKMILADSVFSKNQAKRNQLWKEALPYAIEGWKLAERSGAGNVRYRLALAQANLYARLNDFEKAYKFSHLAMQISEEINDQAKTDAIARMSAEFETELIEAQNTLLRETQKAQVAQLRQQDYLIYGTIVVLVLMVIIGSIIYRSRRNLKKANQVIEKSLSEKELLLKEIHHRVKNNLQVVSSLLDLQSRGIEDETALSTFMEGQNRVKAMALIHQKLYQNENLATVDFAEYAEQLMKELATLYPASNGVTTTINVETEAKFDIDTAVPLGLILNELISNAYKYAFDQNGEGELHVSLKSLGEGKHELTVSDSGTGLPEAFDFAKAKSLGLRLVRRLAKQLYGKVHYTQDAGARFVVNFSETQLRKAV